MAFADGTTHRVEITTQGWVIIKGYNLELPADKTIAVDMSWTVPSAFCKKKKQQFQFLLHDPRYCDAAIEGGLCGMYETWRNSAKARCGSWADCQSFTCDDSYGKDASRQPPAGRFCLAGSAEGT